MNNLPILENPEYSVEDLTIASVDVNHVVNHAVIFVMFDLHGNTIETEITFGNKNEINFDIQSAYFIDGGCVNLDTKYFEDIIPNMKKLFIDEYIFNNVVIQSISQNCKLAILLYKDIRFLCDIKGYLKIQYAFNIETGFPIDMTEAEVHTKTLNKEVRKHINEHKMNLLSNMEVQIVKMYEAAVDNTQYFVRLRRGDVVATSLLGSTNVLEYACYQTKHHTKQECLERAWMMASYLVQFIGDTSMDCVKVVNFTNEESEIIKSDDNIITCLGV